MLDKEGKRGIVRATTLNNLASIAMATGRHDEARKYFAETLETYVQTEGRNSVLYLTGLNNLAVLDYLRGDFARAAEGFAEALEIIENVLGRDHPDWAKTNKHLAMAREKLQSSQEPAE